MDYQPTLQIAANNAVGLDEALKAPSINVINIVTDGKLLLNIEDPPPTTANTIESAAILREKSAYFGKLLDLSKFSESVKFKEKLEMLGREHRHLKPSEIPAILLPNINISDVGQFPKGVFNKAALIRFFEVLHQSGTELPLMSSKSTERSMICRSPLEVVLKYSVG